MLDEKVVMTYWNQFLHQFKAYQKHSLFVFLMSNLCYAHSSSYSESLVASCCVPCNICIIHVNIEKKNRNAQNLNHLNSSRCGVHAILYMSSKD